MLITQQDRYIFTVLLSNFTGLRIPIPWIYASVTRENHIDRMLTWGCTCVCVHVDGVTTDYPVVWFFDFCFASLRYTRPSRNVRLYTYMWIIVSNRAIVYIIHTCIGRTTGDFVRSDKSYLIYGVTMTTGEPRTFVMILCVLQSIPTAPVIHRISRFYISRNVIFTSVPRLFLFQLMYR